MKNLPVIFLIIFFMPICVTAQLFIDTGAQLPAVKNSSMDWGDYDNDGDLDLAIIGNTGSTTSSIISKIFRNDGNAFNDISAAFLEVDNGSIEWGDMDNDGDLDILLTGSANLTTGNFISKVFICEGGDTFFDGGAGLEGVANGNATWGDYDNDGDLDILLVGKSGIGNIISKIYQNDAGMFFENVNANLTGVSNGYACWVDYDNDMDLDVFLMGNTGTRQFTKIYRNDGNHNFKDTSIDLIDLDSGNAAWGDYDNDGDLDLVITGDAGISDGGRQTRLYRNDGNNIFTDIAVPFDQVDFSKVEWGDFDNDGNLDLVLIGSNNIDRFTKIFRNKGDGSFEDLNLSLEGVDKGDIAIGDFNNDHLLDFLVTGEGKNLTKVMHLYKNNFGKQNTPPTKPINLAQSIHPDSVVLKWNASSDAETPAKGLTYNIYIGYEPGIYEFKSPHADIESGYRMVVKIGNVQKQLKWVMRNMPEGNYHWSVQAIDGGYEGSKFADAQIFYVSHNSALVPPDLNAPMDGETGLPTNPSLSWNDVAGATSYHLQLSPFDDFTNIIVDETGIANTWFDITMLADNTTYYWRVRTEQDGTMSPWSYIWHFSVGAGGGGDLMPPTIVSPIDGGTDVPINPTNLQWSDQPNAESYHIQISKDFNFIDVVFEDMAIKNNFVDIAFLDAHQMYYWHAKANYSDGTSPWSPTWNFTTGDGNTIYMHPPVLSSPMENEINVPLDPTGFSWQLESNANSYELQISMDYNFTTIDFSESGITGSYKDVHGLQENTIYYWRVNASYTTGTSAWSPIWGFTTGNGGNMNPPVQNLPVNGAINVSPTMSIIWDYQPTALSYGIQVASNVGFTSMMWEEYGITGNYKDLNGILNNNTTYYWRVNANYSQGTSSWSPIWSFTTEDGGGQKTPPQQDSPYNGELNVPINPTNFSWNSEVDALSYQLQISTASDFITLVVDESGITNTYKDIPGLNNNMTYYWRINAQYTEGASSWSPVWSFKTISDGGTIPPTPTLTAPQDMSTNIPVTPSLKWNEIADVTYWLQVSLYSDFMMLIYDNDQLTNHSVVVPSLANNTTYYWRVSAKNGNGNSNWSDVWSFTTTDNSGAVTLTKPNLVNPSNNETNISTNPIVEWQAVAGAENYKVEISTNSEFTELVYQLDMITTTSVSVYGVDLFNTTYYWHVKAYNGSGESPWSDIWNFKTFQYAAEIDAQKEITFPKKDYADEYTAIDYRLFGFPGKSGIRIDKILNGTQNEDWQVYWDNGQAENYLIEFDSGEKFSLKEGRAFWLICNSNLVIDQNIPSVNLNEYNEALIPLHDGWNLITNPFNISIPWDNVKVANAIDGSIFRFKGSFSVAPSLEPFEGYYYFNSDNAPNLLVPYVHSTAKITSSDGLPPMIWKVNVILSTGQFEDNSTWFGISEQAEKCLDNMDVRKPRAVSVMPVVYFDRPEWDANYSTFAVDVRPEFENSEEWKMIVYAESRKVVKLEFDGVKNIPDEFEVYLIDNERDVQHNLKQHPYYHFTPTKDTTPISVFIGKENALTEKMNSLIPKEYSLRQNFPNPFNLTTTITIGVPADTKLDLKIYNLLGQEISTLHSGVIKAGKHKFEWNGLNQNGRVVPSGVYLYRMIVNSEISFTEKMILMK